MDYITWLRDRVGSDPVLLAGVVVFAFRDGDLLLIHRTDNGLWSTPGGMVEPGESLTRTAVRELAEETGIEADDSSLRLVGAYSGPGYFYRYPNGDQVWNLTVVYGLDHDGSAPSSFESPEAKVVAWHPVATLPSLSPPTARLLRETAVREYALSHTNLKDVEFTT